MSRSLPIPPSSWLGDHLSLEPQACTMTRELDSRVSDGIHVRLLWHVCDGHVSVTVDDAKTGVAFEVLVPEGARALDVFHHPYAYAAMRQHRTNGPCGARRGLAGSATQPSATRGPVVADHRHDGLRGIHPLGDDR